jgi:hypothetical protein
MGSFYDRSQPWYNLQQRESSGGKVWAEAEARFYQDLVILIRAALGPLAEDADAITVLTAVLSSWVLGAIQYSGRSADESVDLLAGVLTAWLDTRVDRD